MRRSLMLLGQRVQGTSVVHRAPLWLKYLVLVAAGLAVLLFRELAVALGALAFSVVAYALAGARVLRLWAAPLRMLWWVFAIIGLHQSLINSPLFALTILSGMFAALQLGRLVLLTTEQSALIDGLAQAAAPLRLVGGDPDALALSVALMLRSIPAIAGAVADVSDAASARGLGRNPLALASPVVIGAVAYARRTGDALAARGIMDRPPSEG
ncbi:energy-coupling factor transporter transmembrane component T family protein [Paeniglutamicibacter cryotolerans]|uniref:Biotin transport system permease protein n=1 Tax=Paeniglutamicibacter cryotolerans TaxID=670079 RepID=A0A839QMS9_9MICC|nr:energy-coupling factor transporter transmembrane protein EcfT [Paeniglutamicibacter cryotolerans]MBB2996893.1 biotin transport system permease protein [Paeniglutamicibacter cryotolerans]